MFCQQHHQAARQDSGDSFRMVRCGWRRRAAAYLFDLPLDLAHLIIHRRQLLRHFLMRRPQRRPAHPGSGQRQGTHARSLSHLTRRR